MDKFFEPKSIAVIGASQNSKKLGNVIVKNLVDHKYQGRIFPINPKGGKIYNQKVYISVKDIPGEVDLAVIVIPAAMVNEVLKECGEKRIRAVVIISAGFGEQDKEGRKREQRLMQTARKYGIRILGPNCLGLIAPYLRLNASFAKGLPAAGNVAVLSQSGAMAVAITDWAISSDVEFSALVSLGNKADVNEEELVSYFGRDEKTKVIVMYLESLSSGRSLLRTIKRVTKLKPVIILKPGRSVKAQQAVASHTGALAGSHEVQNAALKAAGALVVQTLEELLIYTKLFEKPYTLEGERIAIVTNAGGPGILATDAIVSAPNLSLALLSDKTKKELASFLPAAAALDNPVDVVGDASAERYEKALRIILRDKGVDGVIALLTRQYVTNSEKIANAIIQIQKAYRKKPITASFIGGEEVAKDRKKLSEADILHFNYPEQAVKALSVLRKYETERLKPRSFPEVKQVSKGRIVPVLGQEAERLIRRYISNIIPSFLVRSAEQAIKKARTIGYPVVVKVISKQVIHKTDQNLVKLNVSGDEELRKIIEGWQSDRKLRFSKKEGYLVQPFRPGIIEVMVGTKQDSFVGPYLIVGLGGIFVESLTSTSITPLPLTLKQAKELIKEDLLGRMLMSSRGEKLPHGQLAQVLVGMSKLMMEHPNVVECDLNPVMLSSRGVEIADIRLMVRK